MANICLALAKMNKAIQELVMGEQKTYKSDAHKPIHDITLEKCTTCIETFHKYIHHLLELYTNHAFFLLIFHAL